MPKSMVVYSDTVTVAGYALDAREANVNASDSLAAKIQNITNDLNFYAKAIGHHAYNNKIEFFIGDHNFIHTTYNYIPSINAYSNFLFMMVHSISEDRINSIFAFPLDYENRIFVYRSTTNNWLATEMLQPV